MTTEPEDLAASSSLNKMAGHANGNGAGMNIKDIPAGPIGTSLRWDTPEEIAFHKQEKARVAGWEDGYARRPYPYRKRAADIDFAKGYAEGLVAEVEDVIEGEA